MSSNSVTGLSSMPAAAPVPIPAGLKRSQSRPTALAWVRKRIRLQESLEAGLATAEYAVATIAAVAFAGLLLAVLSSGAVRSALTNIIRTALSV